MGKFLEALPKGYYIDKQLDHLLKTSSTDTLLGDMVGNYKKFYKKHCLSGPRMISKGICAYKSSTKYVLFYNIDTLNQTVKYFQLLTRAVNNVQKWTMLLKKNKEFQTSTEDLKITAYTAKT